MLLSRRKLSRNYDSEERFRLVAEAAKVMVYEINWARTSLKSLVGCWKLEKEICNSNYWWFSQIHPDDRAKVELESKSNRRWHRRVRVPCQE
jgi:hypothetical protein